MKISTFAMVLIAAGCSLFLARQATAQDVYGYTTIIYDEASNRVIGYSATELDYSVQEYYRAQVRGTLTDEDGNVLATQTVRELFRRYGRAEVTLEYTVGASLEYKMTGKHTGIADFYQDLPSPPRREYLDYYNFNSFASLGIYSLFDYLFHGPGPLMYRSNSNLVLGDTFAQDARASKFNCNVRNHIANRVRGY